MKSPEQTDIEALIKIGRALVGQTDLEALVQLVTDEATRVTGAEFGAFFYNLVDDKGESYTLYTLSGAPRSAFERFPLPRNTALFAPTFNGEGIVRSDDIRKDPRYGRNAPYHGMPPGHLPVVSYLAAPVVSRTGEVLGGLFFGHREPGIFTERAESVLLGVAALTAIAIDNARLIEREQKARADAEQANRAKDQFLAVLSHELRTPLNAVVGWARMLRTGHVTGAAANRALDVIMRNADAQLRLIDDMLEVSRVVTGKLRLEMRPLDLRAVIDAAVDSVRPAADAKGLRLRSTGEPIDVDVLGDAGRLQQVVWNLLMNGVKFTPPGGQVHIQVTPAASHVEIAVRDTGRGISREMLPHVFERFRQDDSSTTRSYPGLGLGLALSRHLVEMHGGTIEAESAGENQGAVFTVRLPIAGRGHVQPEPRAYAGGEGSPAPSLRGIRVLVVDDDNDTLDLMARILTGAGAEPRLCTSAGAALGELQTWRPDVLIADIEMPDEDGYSLIRRVRDLGDEHGGDTPAIALTAYGRREDRLRSLAAGFNMHVPKPVDPLELTVIVAHLVAPDG